MMNDFTINQAYSELQVVMSPAMNLVPCVYCGATFTTEGELIAHMEAYHPGMPYLISFDSPPTIEKSYSGHNIVVEVAGKLFVPDAPSDSHYQIRTYIHNTSCETLLYRGEWEGLAGFFAGSGHIMSYCVKWGAGYFYLPLGTYRILTRCCLVVGPKWDLTWLWQDADTGQTIIVV
jgi:hypothetical protein